MDGNDPPWVRVSRREPCLICEKPDWCTIGEKGSCCMRIESSRPMANGGWFHAFGDDTPKREPLPSRPIPARPNFAAILHGWRQATTDAQLAQEAEKLRVSTRALADLGTCYAPEYSATAFPMFDEAASSVNEPCGVRLRTEDKKFAVKGSKAGFFFPFGAMLRIPARRIFICEGPTDTAACLDLECFAIGRASCRGGEGMLLSALAQLCPDEVVVVFDNDGPGVAGAEDLVRLIRQPCARLVPPGKDLRKFLADGGSQLVLQSMLSNIRK